MPARGSKEQGHGRQVRAGVPAGRSLSGGRTGRWKATSGLLVGAHGKTSGGRPLASGYLISSRWIAAMIRSSFSWSFRSRKALPPFVMKL